MAKNGVLSTARKLLVERETTSTQANLAAFALLLVVIPTKGAGSGVLSSFGSDSDAAAGVAPREGRAERRRGVVLARAPPAEERRVERFGFGASSSWTSSSRTSSGDGSSTTAAMGSSFDSTSSTLDSGTVARSKGRDC